MKSPSCLHLAGVLCLFQARHKYALMPGHLKPAILQPLVIQGQFQMTSHSQVSSDSLLILHFILENLEAIGSPTRLLYEYIQAFIAHNDVAFEEVVFNLGDIERCA